MFIAKTTVKPHLKSLDSTLHSRNHIAKGCKEGEFQCESDGVCIVGYKVCNNYNDCSDRSDEKYCDFDTGDYVGKALFIFLAHHIHFAHKIINLFIYFGDKIIINICIIDLLMFGLNIFMVLAQSKLNQKLKPTKLS